MTQETELSFHAAAANAERQMQTKLKAFPKAESAFQL